MVAERAGGVERGVCATCLAAGAAARGAGVDWAGGGGGGVALALTGTALWHAAEKRIANPQRDRTLMDKDGRPPPSIRLHPNVGNHPVNTPIFRRSGRPGISQLPEKHRRPPAYWERKRAGSRIARGRLFPIAAGGS